jgi:hypothetical protein
MKIKFTHIISLATCALFFVLTSCRTGKDTAEHVQVKRLNDKEALDLLFSKEIIPFTCFYAKIGIELVDSSRNASFNATTKMRVDSAFSGTMSVGPIIGATYLVTTDSIFFTDKMNNCYFREHISYLTTMFGTEIQYDFFQALVLGLPLGLDEEIKYNIKQTREYYILSSYKKRDLRRIGDDKEGDIFIQYYLNTETHHLDRIAIQVPSDTVTIDIDYQNRIAYDNFYLPEKTKIKIVQPSDSIFIDLDYKNVKLNECKDIGINIPESYVKCKP